MIAVTLTFACSTTDSTTPSTTTSTATPATIPPRSTTVGKVDLHMFDGTWGRSNGRFAAVACAIQDVAPPLGGARFANPARAEHQVGGTIPLAPVVPRVSGVGVPPTTTRTGGTTSTVPTAWNRFSGCGATVAQNPFNEVQVLTIDGSALTARFFDSTCSATITSDDPGVNDDVAVHIDQVICSGRSAPPVDTTLQLVGTDTLVAGGIGFPKRDPNMPFNQTPRSTAPTRAVPGTAAGATTTRAPSP